MGFADVPLGSLSRTPSVGCNSGIEVIIQPRLELGVTESEASLNHAEKTSATNVADVQRGQQVWWLVCAFVCSLGG